MSKLIIKGYSTESFSGGGKSFTANINPEQIQISRGISYNNEDKGTDTAGNTPVFNGYDDDQISFDLFFDGTGLIEGAKRDVAGQIQLLHDVCYTYNGSTHEPYFCKVIWRTINFKCRLKSISTSYTMFKSDGTPLRAKVSLSFVGFISVSDKKSQAVKSSPDMTHIKTVRVGDSLPNLCKEIYGDMRHYQQVAKVNNLVNFRQLEVGSQLFFPPLEK